MHLLPENKFDDVPDDGKDWFPKHFSETDDWKAFYSSTIHHMANPFMCLMHFIENVGPELYACILSTLSPQKRQEFGDFVHSKDSSVPVGGQSHAGMSVAKMRRFWLKFDRVCLVESEDIWLQRVGKKMKKEEEQAWITARKAVFDGIRQVVQDFVDIIGLIYITDSTQWNMKTVLRMIVAIFSFSQWLRRLFPPTSHPSLYKRPLHWVESHLPYICRHYLPWDMTSELDEGYWRKLRKAAQRSNNHGEEALMQMFTLMHFRDQLDYTVAGDLTRKKDTEKEKLMSELHNSRGQRLPEWMVNSDNFKFLLYQIRDYDPKQWYTNEEEAGTLYFFTAKDAPVRPQPEMLWAAQLDEDYSQARPARQIEEEHERLKQLRRFSDDQIRLIEAARPQYIREPVDYTKNWISSHLLDEKGCRKKNCLVTGDVERLLNLAKSLRGLKGEQKKQALAKQLQFDDDILENRARGSPAAQQYEHMQVDWEEEDVDEDELQELMDSEDYIAILLGDAFGHASNHLMRGVGTQQELPDAELHSLLSSTELLRNTSAESTTASSRASILSLVSEPVSGASPPNLERPPVRLVTVASSPASQPDPLAETQALYAPAHLVAATSTPHSAGSQVPTLPSPPRAPFAARPEERRQRFPVVNTTLVGPVDAQHRIPTSRATDTPISSSSAIPSSSSASTLTGKKRKRTANGNINPKFIHYNPANPRKKQRTMTQQ